MLNTFSVQTLKPLHNKTTVPEHPLPAPVLPLPGMNANASKATCMTLLPNQSLPKSLRYNRARHAKRHGVCVRGAVRVSAQLAKQPNPIGVHALTWVGGWSEEECTFAARESASLGYDLVEVISIDNS